MRILYICTHNRCRSILSEAITNHYGKGQLTGASAGSQPVGEVHPLSLHYLAETGVKTEGLRSKSWDEMQSFLPDVVVTVCDSAASEPCPLWFDDTLVLHWGLTDPSKLDGCEEDIRAAFLETIAIIKTRVSGLVALAEQNLPTEALRLALRELAQTQC